MKKLRFLSALFVATGLTALNPAKALAEDLPALVEGNNDGITIEAIDNSDYYSADGYNLYSFVAPETGLISVAASGEGDSYGALFSADKELLINDDESNDNNDFKFVYNVDEGETYYIGLRSFFESETLYDYTITIQYETSVVIKTKIKCAGYEIGLPGYVYAAYAGTEDVVSEAVPFGTEIDLHADEIPGLEFLFWEDDYGQKLEEATITASPSDANNPYYAFYDAPSGKSFVPIWGNESCLCNGFPFILKTEDSAEEVTLNYTVDESLEFDHVQYREDLEYLVLEDVVNDPMNCTLTFTVPVGCKEIYVEFKDKPYLEIHYNDVYTATVDDLTMGEDGAYYGTFYVEESVYAGLSIDGFGASEYWVSYSYTRKKVDDADVFVLTLLDEENEPVAVFNLTVVKGHTISLICDPDRGRMTVEGNYVKINETEDHETMDIFVLTGGECTAKAESIDPKEYTFVAWNLGDEDFEVTDPTLTLTSSSYDYWEAVFSSKSYAKVWLDTYPSSVYAWLTDSEGNKIFDNEGHTEFDGDGNPVDDEKYVCELIVRKGSKVTLHYEESIGDLTFSKLVDTMTDEVCESATVTVTDDVEFGVMYQRTVKTTNGWMTYCDGSDNYTVEGGKAYTAHYQEAAGEEPACVVLTSIDGVIAWNEGILISSETSATIAYTYYGADNVEDNELYGNHNDYTMVIADSRLDGKTLYGLYNQDPAQIGFKRYKGATLPPHKAVLVAGCTAGDLNFEAPLRIVIDNEEVGIIQVAAGQDPIDAVFDLLGRRQNADNAKGLRIREGKVTWGK